MLSILKVIMAVAVIAGATQASQGPEVQDSLKRLNVHLVPHSHMDASWLVPAETYYHSFVKKILNSVVDAMRYDHEKTFAQAEIYFFQRWYAEQDESVKEKVKEYVAAGRFEFVNGGWVAHDEACPSFNAIISNIQEGHRFLKQEFGVVPRIAWQVDTFGNSAGNALLFSQMGYEALVIGKINEDQFQNRIQKKELEFYWKPYFSDHSPLGTNKIFTTILANGYTAPVVKLDNNWEKASIEKDSNKLMKDLNAYFYFLSNIYRTSHILVPMGDDFSFIDAKRNYEIIDEVIEVTRQYDTNINIFYSTPQKYFDAVAGETKMEEINWEEYDSDFFPYMTQDEQQFWTGYFTTRPDFKAQIGFYESLTYSSSFLYSMEFMRDPSKQEFYDQSFYLMSNLSVLMHHDTITGTSAQKAIDILYKDIKRSVKDNVGEISKIIDNYAQIQGYQLKALSMCEYEAYDRQKCPSSKQARRISKEDDKLLLVLYNPSLEKQRIPWLNFDNPYIEFNRWNRETKDFEDIYAEAFCFTNSEMERECDLFLNATVEPLDVSIVRVVIQQDDYDNVTSHVQPSQVAKKDVISNGKVALEYEEYDFLTGKVYFWMQDTYSKAKQEVGFDFRQYLSPNEEMSGGHYVFHSDDSDSEPYYHKLTYAAIYKGLLVEEYLLNFRNMREMVFRNVPYSQMDYQVKVRVYKDAFKDETIEWDVFLGRIPNQDHSLEVTINWQAYTLQNQGVFYTDANAYKMIKRRARDIHHEDEFHEYFRETASANFYPVTSGIAIEDKQHHTTLAILNDKPMAGGSYIDGRVELLINRRLYTDDGMGIPENLDEKDELGNGLNVSAKFYTVLTTSKEKAFSKIWDYYNRRLWQVQTFYTQKYSMMSEQNDGIFLNSHRALLVRAFHLQQVKNFVMIPDNREGKTFQLRLTMQEEGLTPDLTDVVKQLCKLTFYQDDSWCEIQTMSYNQRRLDGVQESQPNDNLHTLVQIFEVGYEPVSPVVESQ